MPNSNAPFGFRPIRHLTGGAIRASKRRIASGYATAIYSGDPVKLAADGTIQRAAAGDRLLGIFGGASWIDTDGTVQFSPYWPASRATLNSVAAEAMVYDDPNLVFEVQSGGTPALTDVGLLADHVAGTGSAATGRSGDYLNSSMATSAAGFRVLDFTADPKNEVGQYARLEVQIFEHELAEHGQATPGV